MSQQLGLSREGVVQLVREPASAALTSRVLTHDPWYDMEALRPRPVVRERLRNPMRLISAGSEIQARVDDDIWRFAPLRRWHFE